MQNVGVFKGQVHEAHLEPQLLSHERKSGQKKKKKKAPRHSVEILIRYQKANANLRFFQKVR